MSAAAARIPTQAMKIEKVKEHIGAIVTGIDLAHPIDGATQKKLYDAVVENVVLVIRGQEHLTPGQVQAAGEMFGELMEDQNRRYLVDGFPLISVLDNRHLDSKGQPAKVGGNATWHTDHTNQELPPKFTMLYAVAVPDKGGGTSVCNSRAGLRSAAGRHETEDRRREDREYADQQRADEDSQSGYREGPARGDETADGASPGPHPPGDRHQGCVVSQGQDRDGDRHVARRNPGFSAGFDRQDHAAAILLCARVSRRAIC